MTGDRPFPDAGISSAPARDRSRPDDVADGGGQAGAVRVFSKKWVANGLSP